MEYDSIERELHIDASPEVVFEVISRPEHLREWWPDDATLDPVLGGQGELFWASEGHDAGNVVPLTIVEMEPPRLFSFRWAYEPGLIPDRSNSFLVTLELEASGAGTLVHFSETGFREQGWEVAKLEAAYLDHVAGWDFFLPRLAAYSARLATTS